MKTTILVLLLITCVAYAGDKKSGNNATQFWNGPIEKVPEIPKVAPTPTPTPNPTTVSQRQVEPRRVVQQIDTTRPIRQSNTTMRVGRSIPVPTTYSPPQVSGSTVIPSTPRRFTTVETGVTMSNGSVTMTEFEGFINYGSPINTPTGQVANPILVPVFNRIEIK